MGRMIGSRIGLGPDMRRACHPARHSRCAPMSIDPAIFKAYDIRGIYGEQLDGERREQIGRAFARVISALSGKPAVRVAARSRPRHAADRPRDGGGATRAGMQQEGADVLDAGMVGTEMLYYLVGSRELDGGLMCTASHNPKAYTGAKLVERGAIALSGDSGIGDIRRLIDGGTVSASAHGRRLASSTSTSTTSSTQAALAFIDPAAIRAAAGRRRRRQRHGRTDGRPAAGPARARARSRPTGPRTATSPTTSPTRCCPRTASSSCARSSARAAPISGSPGTATPTAASSSTTPARSSTATSSRRCSPSRCCASKSRRDDPLRRAREPRGRRHRQRGRRHGPTSTASGTRSSRRGCARRAALFGGEVSGHYYFRDFYCADSGHDPGAADPRAALASGASACPSCSSRYRARYFISGEINSEVADPAGQDRRDRRALRRRAPGSTLDGISIDYDDWHFNVRPSNTEPLLRLCLESLRSREDMEARRDEVLALIRS